MSSLRLFGFSLLLLLLNACASQPALPRLVWPPPPDEPRLEFVGNYYSEQDFEKTASQQNLDKLLGESSEAVFQMPFGIVADGRGTVFVSDMFDRNLRVYDFNQRTVKYLTKEPVFGNPTGLALDSRGFLYIADASQNRIFVFDASRQPAFIIKDEEHLQTPAYLALNEPLGRLYVSDGKQSRIVVFDLKGDYLFSFGETGQAEGKFYSPQGLAFGPDGNLYICDMLNARIQIFSPEGEYVSQFGERGDQASQFENPKDLAFDSEGNLHIIDARRSSLYTYTPDGKLLLVTGSGSPTTSQFGFSVPKSIYIDANDRIYVAETLGKRFTVWQYLSQAYLAKHPFTAEDQQRLHDYIENVKAQSKTAE